MSDALAVDPRQVRLGVALAERAEAVRWCEAMSAHGFQAAQADPDTLPAAAPEWEALLLPGGAAGEALLAGLMARGTLGPVCFVLADPGDLKAVERCFALGADDVFSPRLSPEILKARLLRHLRHRAALEQMQGAHERGHRLFLNVVKVMVKVLETKDEYTKFHSDNVSRYSRMIAGRLGLPRQEINDAGLAGLLHDFGKIGVAEKILNKSTKLTDQEFAIVKRHPAIGGLILESISGIEAVLPGIRYHHERMDGTGYPEGLKGEAIPLLGRIVGAADAFDTLTSDRTYHRRITVEDGIRELRRCAGTQFDPQVVEALAEALQPPAQAQVAEASRKG